MTAELLGLIGARTAFAMMSLQRLTLVGRDDAHVQRPYTSPARRRVQRIEFFFYSPAPGQCRHNIICDNRRQQKSTNR